jgi:hypothetical protein
MIQVFPLPTMSFSDSLDAHFVPFAARIWHLGEVEKTIFQGKDWTSEVIFAFCKAQITNLTWFAKALI